MSERLPGLPEAPPAAPPRDATAILLWRMRDGVREVFWVKRGRQLAHFAGFRAFPGGRMDDSDREVALADFEPFESTLRVCAVRELFEETGVLLLKDASRLPAEKRRSMRQALLDGKLTMAELLRQSGTEIDVARLIPAGRWITPDFLAVRYDARMFLVELPAGEEAEVWPGELAEGEWIKPERALERWAAGETLLHPPNLNALQSMANDGRSLEARLTQLRSPAEVRNFVADRIEFQQGLKLFPLKTPTLPPATHTNCYLVGNRELLLFDPGAYDGVEQERLASFVERLRAEGYVPKAVVLTHHHADHVGSVEMLRSRFGLELWCHAETASRVGRAERLLVEGDRLVLNGEPEFVLEVLHTPGHARGHLCFFHRNSRALICGDMVAAQSTIIIDPPEGNLAHYLASLERLRALPPGTLYQAHGAPIAEGTAKLDEYLAHRRMRVEALYEALAKGPRTLSDLVAEVYADVPEVIHPIAERSALASLEYLIEQKRLRRSGERFERVDSNAV